MNWAWFGAGVIFGLTIGAARVAFATRRASGIELDHDRRRRLIRIEREQEENHGFV